MIQTVNNTGINTYNSTTGRSSVIRTGKNTSVQFDDFLQTQAAILDNDSSQISPEDAIYLNAIRMPDGSEIQFPPATAPVAAQKAWIEAMKKMSPEQRAFAQAKMTFPTQYDPSANISDIYNLIQKNLSGITSYQDLFNKQKADMEKKKLYNTNNLEGLHECQEMIQAWSTLTDTFAKYNIK